MKSSSGFIRLIVTTSLMGILLFLIFGSQIKKHIEEKLFESTYQFFLITVMGGGVSLVYEAYRRECESQERQKEIERESRERQKEIQRNLRSTLIAAYHDLKKVRRLLRAQAISLEPGTGKLERMIVWEEYNKQLEKLIDAELSIEEAVRVIESEPKLFQHSTSGNTESGTHKQLVDELIKIKEYLNEVISEYEQSYKTFANCSVSRNLSELPKLLNFIGSKDEAKGSNTIFWTPFHTVLELLSKVLQN
ncbi:hypothetical protein F7734_15955 [Scytonema sp. UIC 10036]|uniref:hypothetical protein n=1 Tax=Scytonema sp. UIC 10036 TaxID=2304196 RepID=UPI0012DA090D|nr:hypothetical protein [Scytonema sp. UIC 10036]MUG93824.1 hypothetical protein [Scytonema sp. UIC 10036]